MLSVAGVRKHATWLSSKLVPCHAVHEPNTFLYIITLTKLNPVLEVGSTQL